MMIAATMKLTTTPTKITKMMTYSLLERSTGMMTVVLTEWLPAPDAENNDDQLLKFMALENLIETLVSMKFS
jgi:hypothetical protein